MMFTFPKDLKLVSSADYSWNPKLGTTLSIGKGKVYSVCAALAMQFIYEGYRFVKDDCFLFDDMMSLVKENWIRGDLILTVLLILSYDIDS